MAILKMPIEVKLQVVPVSEMPISMSVDFLQFIPAEIRNSGILDLFSLRMFENMPDGELRRRPVQFSPDRLSSPLGTLTWMLGREPADSTKRNFVLYVDLCDTEKSGQTVMEGSIFGDKIFEKNKDAKKLPYFPKMQTVPVPGSKVSIQRDGVEVLGYNYGTYDANSVRPYFFPLIGPSGRYLTRIGHPHDPVGHRHHYSIWVSFYSVNGMGFWDDNDTSGRQRHQKFLFLSDGPVFGGFAAIIHWRNPDGETLMEETRRVSVYPLSGDELLIDFELTFSPLGKEVQLSKTQFGFLAVRVAKSMGVFDGSGRIQNSEGAVNEKEIFWNRAKWCDYSGPVTKTEWNGISIFDNPNNPNYPSHWHVRSDGWMSPCPFFENSETITPDKNLVFSYRLFVHAGDTNAARVQDRYEEYTKCVGIEVQGLGARGQGG